MDYRLIVDLYCERTDRKPREEMISVLYHVVDLDAIERIGNCFRLYRENHRLIVFGGGDTDVNSVKLGLTYTWHTLPNVRA